MTPEAHRLRRWEALLLARLGRARARAGQPAQPAFVLVSVLVVVMLSSMVAVSLLFRVRAETVATATTAGTEQAWSAAMSGVEETIRQVAAALPGTTDWQDNPRVFKDRLVFEDGSDRWYFTVCSPSVDDALRELRYGPTDEGGKVNINASHTTNLLHLPRMTSALVAALRDFIDFDDVVRQDGAEQEFYDTLPVPYSVRNGRLDSVDELLLVRGFTPALLYGEDANMNWRLDPNEQDGNERFPPDNNDSRLDLGLRQYLTAVSYDPNQDNDGVPRTNLNNARERLPGVTLPEAVTNYIAALRANKVRVGHAADLLEAKLTIKNSSGRPVEIASGVGKEELPRILDLFTATSAAGFEGLLNVNTASIAALQTVPGIDESLAEAILSTRRSISPEHRTTIAWLFQEGLVDAPLFKQLAPYLTARALQFSCHVVGYGLPSGRYRVLDVLIDLSGGKPRIAYLRDITRLGLPFRLEPQEAPDA
jgi:type II secretory pathway component PulK